MISALYPYCEQMRNAVGWPQSCLRSSTPWRIDAGIVSRSRTNSTWLALSERRCQLATAACAVVLTAYPASLLLFESGLLAPLAVPLGYIGAGFAPMALWMRKAERW